MVFLFFINPANSAFVCKPCPLNYYCKSDKVYSCPDSAPVTLTTGAKSEADCTTCILRDESTATPVFDGADCVSCYESSYQSENPTHIWQDNTCVSCAVATDGVSPVYSDPDGGCITCEQSNPDTPYWDGTACVSCLDGDYKEDITCAEGTEWNGTECVEGLAAIPSPDGVLIIKEVINPYANSIFVSKANCEAMVAATDEAGNKKYKDVTQCNYEPDYWAGSYKYCVDKGMRLPTMQELAYIAQEIYGDTSIERSKFNITITNQELFNTILAGTYYESKNMLYLWSSEQNSDSSVYYRFFDQSNTEYLATSHRDNRGISAFCLGD